MRLAAPEGIERLSRSGLPLRLVTAAIDQGLNEKCTSSPASATRATASSAACAASNRGLSPRGLLCPSAVRRPRQPRAASARLARRSIAASSASATRSRPAPSTSAPTPPGDLRPAGGIGQQGDELPDGPIGRRPGVAELVDRAEPDREAARQHAVVPDALVAGDPHQGRADPEAEQLQVEVPAALTTRSAVCTSPGRSGVLPMAVRRCPGPQAIAAISSAACAVAVTTVAVNGAPVATSSRASTGAAPNGSVPPKNATTVGTPALGARGAGGRRRRTTSRNKAKRTPASRVAPGGKGRLAASASRF